MRLLESSRKGTTVILAMAMLLLVPTFAMGKAANPGLVPAKSAYVISIPDLPGLWKAWKVNAIYAACKKVLATADVASQIEPLAKDVETVEKALGFKLDGDTVAQVFKSMDLYLVPGENAGSPSVGIVLGTADVKKLEKLLDLAEKAAASAATLPAEDKDDSTTAPAEDTKGSSGTLGGGTGKEGDDAQTSGPITVQTYRDVTVKKFEGGEYREVYYAVVGDLLLASNEPAEMKALIDRSKGDAQAETLGASADYKKTESGLESHSGEIYVFVNHERALELQPSVQGMEVINELFRKFAPSTMSNSSIKFEPKQIVVFTYSPLREGEDGAAGKELFKKHPADKSLEIASFAPAKCLLLVATNLVDSKMLQQYASSLMGMLGAGGGTGAIDERIKAFETQMGFSLKDDLVPAVGNEGAFMLNSVQMSGLIPSVDAAIVVKIGDKEKMKKVLSGIEKFAGATLGAASAAATKDKTETESSGTPALKTEMVGGTTVKYVELPSVPGYSPAFAVTGDYLVIATSKGSISGLVDTKAGKSPSLVGSDVLKALAPRVTAVANNLSFANLQEIWSTVGSIAEKFPVGETVAKVVDVLKVFKAAGSSEKAAGDAVVSEMVLLLN